jgi:type IV pilus assembly protein PilE
MKMQNIRKTWGFTLMELMIAVAVVGILAAVAFPSYQSQVIKTRRSDGKAALMSAAAKQEQYYLDNKTYADTLAKLNVAAASPEGYYQIRITASSATAFTLQAAPQGSQTSDTICGNLTLNNLGTKTESGSGTVNDCW